VLLFGLGLGKEKHIIKMSKQKEPLKDLPGSLALAGLAGGLLYQTAGSYSKIVHGLAGLLGPVEYDNKFNEFMGETMGGFFQPAWKVVDFFYESGIDPIVLPPLAVGLGGAVAGTLVGGLAYQTRKLFTKKKDDPFRFR
jgi:hypothetical protein